jgi:cytosine/adenosine deaminase-related metal-dependent hydrolase
VSLLVRNATIVTMNESWDVLQGAVSVRDHRIAAILTMETVHDTDVVCDEIARSGLRATIAKCMMDDDEDRARSYRDGQRAVSGRYGTGISAAVRRALRTVDEPARALLADHDVKVLHCPGSNLKLGSRLAPIVELRHAGVTVSLGADGAACNNRLDMFDEMRLAVLIQWYGSGRDGSKRATP